MKNCCKIFVYVLVLFVFTFSCFAVSSVFAQEKTKKKSATKTKESKKVEKGIKYGVDLGVEYESPKTDNKSGVKNSIYKPAFTINYKGGNAGDINFKVNSSVYSKNDTKNVTVAALEYKKKNESLVDVGLKANYSSYPKNKEKNATTYALDLSKKFNEKNTTSFNVTYSPDLFATYTSIEDKDEDATEETESATDETSDEEESSIDECYDYFISNAAADEAGNPLDYDGDGISDTWWQAAYADKYNEVFTDLSGDVNPDTNAVYTDEEIDVIADEEAFNYAEEQATNVCASDTAVDMGTVTLNPTQVKTQKTAEGSTVSYALKHIFALDKLTSLSLQGKIKDVSWPKDQAIKEIDNLEIEAKFDKKLNPKTKFSLSYLYDKGDSAVQNKMEGSDKSYKENEFKIAVSNDLSANFSLSLDYGYATKKYTTTNSLDPDKDTGYKGDSNNGRKDNIQTANVSLSYKPQKNLEYILKFSLNSTDQKYTAKSRSIDNTKISTLIKYDFVTK